MGTVLENVRESAKDIEYTVTIRLLADPCWAENDVLSCLRVRCGPGGPRLKSVRMTRAGETEGTEEADGRTRDR